MIQTSSSDMRLSVLSTARAAREAGISVLPIRNDGTKRPVLSSWREYQQRCASEAEIERWFRSGEPGIAFVTGAVSSLEALDFDDESTFLAWQDRGRADPVLAPLCRSLSWGYLEVTPSGGRHVLYRCEEGIEGNLKLASRPDGDNRRKTLIETRGEGGLIIVAPSAGGVHPSGNPYKMSLGRVSSIRTITREQRRLLLDSARQFDEMPAPPTVASPPVRATLVSSWPSDCQLPGRIFNQRTTWEEILVPHGWMFVFPIGETKYWRRPGKRGPGISATTNHDRTDRLFVFSTSTEFETDCYYSKFAAYTLLKYGSTSPEAFQAAARDLAQRGYR